jgi:hypothetical protein
MSSTLEQSLTAGPHQQLLQLAGEWQGTTRTWFEPGNPVDESPMAGTIRPLFDGRFVLHEYKGSFQGKPFEGICIMGYHLLSQTFQSAWVDTFHMGTGIMLSESTTNHNFFSVLGSYSSGGEQPEQWGWRTEVKLEDENNIILTAYNISPAGEESLATETRYARKQA